MAWFKIFVIQYIHDVLRTFRALQIFFVIFLFKWGIKGSFEPIAFKLNNFYFKLKNILCFPQGLFFSNGHIHSVVSELF